MTLFANPNTHTLPYFFLAAFDTELMKATLIDLSLGKKVQIPKYNLKTRMRYILRFKQN